MSANAMTLEEMSLSLTGFDEIAIEKHLGFDVYEIGESKPTKATRALVFVALRREGQSDLEAKNAVLEMPLSEVTDYFAEPEVEIDPDEPETPSGEGFAPAE